MNNVVINFEVKDEALESVLDKYARLGIIEKQVAEEIKKTNVEQDKKVQTLNRVVEAEKKSVDINKLAGASLAQFSETLKELPTIIAGGAVSEQMKEVADTINVELAKAGVTLEQFNEELKNQNVDDTNFLDKISQSADVVTAKSKSFKAELKELKAQLAILEDQGKENTKEFQEMAIRAAQLEDQIGDTSARIRAMASDTFVFDGITSGLNGLVGGFSAAQGAAAFFGNENKELQETLVRLNALIAASNGLAQVKNALEKQSAFVQLVRIGQTRLESASIALNTAAESSNVAVKYAAIAAQKALNLVQSISPVGALALLVGGLVLAYNALSGSSKNAAESQEQLNTAQKQYIDYIKFQEDAVKKISERRIADLENQKKIAEAEGKSRDYIRELDRQIDNERTVAAARRIEINQRAIKEVEANEQAFLDKITKQQQFLVELEKKKLNGVTAYYDAAKKQNIPIDELIKSTKDFIDVQTTMYNQAKATLKDYNTAVNDSETNAVERSKQKAKEILEDDRALIQARIILAKAGSDERLKAEIDLIQKEKEIKLKDSSTSPAQKALIEIEAQKQITEKKVEFTQREIAAQIKLNEIKIKDQEQQGNYDVVLQKQIENVELATKAELSAKNKSAEEIKVVETKAAQDIETLKINASQATAQRQLDFDRQSLSLRAAVEKEWSIELLQIRKDEIEAAADQEKSQAQETIKNKKQLAQRIKEIDEKSAADKQAIDNDAFQKELEYQNKVLQLTIDIENKKLQAQLSKTTNADERNAIQQKIYDNELILLNKRQSDIDALEAKGIISHQDAELRKLQLTSDRISGEISEEQRKAQEVEEINRQISDTLFGIYQNLLDSQFQIDKNNRDAQTSEQLRALNKQRENELKNKSLTEKQKEKIDADYDKKVAKIKLEAWKADQEAAKTQAIINGALAVVRALATINYPMNLVVAAAYAVTTALQIDVINSQKPPQYFKGVERVPLGNNPKGKDTVHAMVNEGERIIPTETNEQYFNALSSIHNKKVSTEFAEAVLTGNYKNYKLKSITSESPIIEKQFKKFVETNVHQVSHLSDERINSITNYQVNATASIDSNEVAEIVARQLRDKSNQMIRSNHDVIKALKDINESLNVTQHNVTLNDKRWQA